MLRHYRHRKEGVCKTAIWAKTHLETRTLDNLATSDFETVKLSDTNDIQITSFYEETEGAVFARLDEFTLKLRDM